MYQDSSDESPSSDYYGGHGGQSGGRTFMIFARTSPSGYTEGSSNASNASSTSSGYSSSRGGGGSREAMSSGGMGESLYKNYTQSYGYSSHGCAHEDYQPVSVVYRVHVHVHSKPSGCWIIFLSR